MRWIKYGTQSDIRFTMVKRGVVDLAASADWTPAAADSAISKDGGNLADTTNTVAAVSSGTATRSGVDWMLTISATEAQAAEINIQIVDAATKAVEDQFLTVYTYGNASAKFAGDWSDIVRLGLTAFPNAATGTAGALLVDGTGTAAISNSAGKVLLQATQAGVTIPTVTTVTNQLTAAAIATGIWQDTTAGDFTVASSVGKSLMNGVALGTGLTIVSVSGAVGSVTARVTANVDQVDGASLTAHAAGKMPADVLTIAGTAQTGLDLGGTWTAARAAHLDDDISSRMATYTQPSGFLAATFPTGTVANTTNITAGTITTATNLTNAPTAGDFTAAMKTSLNAATPAVTVSDKTGFILTAAYDPAKTASQAGDAMALTGGERTSLAGVINTTAIVESYRANGAPPTPAQFMSEVIAHLGESSIAGTTKTTHKLDHVTTAQTFTLDDGTTPTSITRAS